MAAAAYASLSGRAKWAQRALITIIVLNAIGAFSAFFAYQLYGRDLITQDDLDRTDLREGLVALVTPSRTSSRSSSSSAGSGARTAIFPRSGRPAFAIAVGGRSAAGSSRSPV